MGKDDVPVKSRCKAWSVCSNIWGGGERGAETPNTAKARLTWRAEGSSEMPSEVRMVRYSRRILKAVVTCSSSPAAESIFSRVCLVFLRYRFTSTLPESPTEPVRNAAGGRATKEILTRWSRVKHPTLLLQHGLMCCLADCWATTARKEQNRN